MDGLRDGLFSGWGEVVTFLETLAPEIQARLLPVVMAAQAAGGDAGRAFGRAMIDAIAAIPAPQPPSFPRINPGAGPDVGPNTPQLPGGGTAIRGADVPRSMQLNIASLRAGGLAPSYGSMVLADILAKIQSGWQSWGSFILGWPGMPSGTHDFLIRHGLPQSFDRGGWLMPGATLAYNGTGRPERVGGPTGDTFVFNHYGTLMGNDREATDFARKIEYKRHTLQRQRGG